MLGWSAGILLSLCGVPELLRAIQDSKCHLGYGMLSCWLLGEILAAIHVYRSHRDFALLTNYGINIIILIVLWYYKIIYG
jgi:uncharacterized protein with PQ loop repeat